MTIIKKNKEALPDEPDDLETMSKFGIIIDSIEKRVSEETLKEIDSTNETLIEKANKKKDKEIIQEIQETQDDLEGISKEMVSLLFIPIDLFINESLQSKSIDPISESEILKLFELIIQLLPKNVLTTITETAKKTKKISWLKNIDKVLAFSKHLLVMYYKRFQQYKVWKELNDKNKKL